MLDGRPLIKTWDVSLEYLWIFGWSVFSATLHWRWRYAGGLIKFSPWRAISTVVAGGSLVVGTYIAFLAGWWIPVIPPFLTLVGSAIAIITYVALSAIHIRQTFSRYLTDQVVANLLETPEGLNLGGELRKVTILMTDLRGFSAVSERLKPGEVVTFLNIYLGIMADIITQYSGTIDEFIGDAILVIFGAPNQREDDSERAVACALAMQAAMQTVNEKIKHLNIPKLEMGIGINTGEVVAGNIGSQKRAKYGVVGSHVNLTGRIESYTVGGQILVSEYTLQDTGPILKINQEMQVEPKGIKQPITLYDVVGIAGKYNIYLEKEAEKFFPIESPLTIQFNILEGKHVAGNMINGSLVKISANGAEISSENSVEILKNLKLNLLTGNHPGDIYGMTVPPTIRWKLPVNTQNAIAESGW